MDPIEVLDVLGNENRRRILRLLSFRPFYFNEIARRLDVGPKAVIAHLDMLERAGLVECYTDQGRRKYFRIARNMVLEVAVSPHSYGVRTYLPVSNLQPRKEEVKDLKYLQEELDQVAERRLELRRRMEELDQRATELRSLAVSEIEKSVEDKLESEILVALLSGETDLESLASRLEFPPVVVDDCLRRLEGRGAVKKVGEMWKV